METNGSCNEKLAPLAVPEDDDSALDTQFIHWGYVNCCQTVSNGKKAKKEIWNTYWLELCGSTLRFYRDSSLPVNSNLLVPPSTPNYILEESETKGAFFTIKNAEVKILPDGKFFSQSFLKKTRKNTSAKIFRRHLFQLKLRQIHSNYVFQSPSRSAMLRWVSKIQESLDAYEHNKKSESPEQRLKLARGILRKNVKPHDNTIDTTDLIDGSLEKSLTISDDNNKTNPVLCNLKNKLSYKREQIWQFEMQIIDFLGRGKGQFRRDESICVLKQDYILVPGQIETFVPAGTNVKIFGQLPNRRWRCLVESNELLKTFNILINDLSKDDSAQRSRDITSLKNLLNNLPDYPLIGCLPSSVIQFEQQTDNEQELMTKITSENLEIKLLDNFTDSDEESIKSRRNSEIYDNDLKVSTCFGSGNTSETDDISDLNEAVQLRVKGAGIIIKKKLRQKGISIIVGSSSSEGEYEEDIQNDL